MGFEQSIRIGGKWNGIYLVLPYEDVLSASSYKSIHLRSVRRSEFIIPQVVDPTTPVIFPLVENIVRFPFEKRLTMTQQDADNRKNLQLMPGADARASAVPIPIADAKPDDSNATPTDMPSSQHRVGVRAPTISQQDFDPDTWEVNRTMLIRHINTPRKQMFSPQDSPDDCPIPLKFIDVWRSTYTNCCQKHEMSIFDVWVNDVSDNAELSELWIGQVKFYILELPPKTHICGLVANKRAFNGTHCVLITCGQKTGIVYQKYQKKKKKFSKNGIFS